MPRRAVAPSGRRAAAPSRRGPARAARPAAGLERLWAPWRMPYIRTADRPGGCLFCRVRASRAARPHLVLARRGQAFLMMNRFPYTSGHLMVAVARHAPDFASLTEAERADLLALVALAERALQAEYHPHGLNVGANLGRVAGAGFPGHLHVHLVPRWDGDTNFMPVVGQTRVLPEALDATWRRLRRALAALEPRQGAAPGRPPRPLAGRATPRRAAGRGRVRGRRA